MEDIKHLLMDEEFLDELIEYYSDLNPYAGEDEEEEPDNNNNSEPQERNELTIDLDKLIGGHVSDGQFILDSDGRRIQCMVGGRIHRPRRRMVGGHENVFNVVRGHLATFGKDVRDKFRKNLGIKGRGGSRKRNKWNNFVKRHIHNAMRKNGDFYSAVKKLARMYRRC
jgi:hypothetical protein